MTNVEASVQGGLPEFRIVGLPDRSVREAVVRVKSAILASGLKFPSGRVIVNISPAELPKRGVQFDLAIALAILSTNAGPPEPVVALGELGLTGAVSPTHLGRVTSAYAATLKVPCLLNSDESHGLGARIATLAEAWNVLAQSSWRIYDGASYHPLRPKQYLVDSIRGNDLAKRALLISLAGRHHLLLSGPPGVGKTLLGQAAAELIPRLNEEEECQLSIMEGQLPRRRLRSAYAAPYAAPLHNISIGGLLGTFSPFKPGELSLSSYGVLFLDELPHMQSSTLAALYEPLESGYLHFGSHDYATIPACPVVIAARNLCPCGRKGDPTAKCLCTPTQQGHYERRLSAPLLDRFPLSVELSAEEPIKKLVNVGSNYAGMIAQVREQIMTISLTQSAKALIDRAADSLGLSFRAQSHVRSVAETIAKLDNSGEIRETHVQEAMQYRVR